MGTATQNGEPGKARLGALSALRAGGAFIAADVGGTNARVAAVRTDADGGVELLSWQRYPCDDYPDLAAILARFLADHPAHAGVDCMVIASAGVVLGDEVINSNLPWRISLSGLRQRLALRELHVVNDFEAAAHGTACLRPADTRLLTPGLEASCEGTALVIGPGTGLGAAFRIPRGGSATVLPTEAGMTAFAPGSERELDLLRWMWRQGNRHVCTEQLLSGPGLVNIHAALRDSAGLPTVPMDPAAISTAARAGDAVAHEAVRIFCALLGSVIGDLVVIGSARSVFIAGGIVPQIVDFLPQSDFRTRLIEKGAMRPVLERVPVRLIQNERLGVLGAAIWYLQYLMQDERREFLPVSQSPLS